MSLPYSVVVEESGELEFSATVVELAGCTAQGDSEKDARSRLKAAKEEWLRKALDKGEEIPEPSVLNDAIEAAIKLKQAENSATNLEMLHILMQIKDGKLTLDDAIKLFSHTKAQRNSSSAQAQDSSECDESLEK